MLLPEGRGSGSGGRSYHYFAGFGRACGPFSTGSRSIGGGSPEPGLRVMIRTRKLSLMSGLPSRERLAADRAQPEVEIRRSAKRRKTISARWEGDMVVLLAPAGMTTSVARDYLRRLLPKLLAERSARREDPRRTDAYLEERAAHVARSYLDDRVKPVSIGWVTNQNTRWGSTTPATGKVRISHHLWSAPEYVVDYVIHHELCHLVEASHNARFRKLEALFPHAGQAKAFLEGMVFERNRLEDTNADPA